jgi:hypothetical protein
VPTVKVDVVNWATPLAFSVTGDPKLLPLSLNCTVPTGVPDADVTVAVNVTLCASRDGFADDERAVAVLAWLTFKVKLASVMTPQLSVERTVIT